jgi:hypothetical protein
MQLGMGCTIGDDRLLEYDTEIVFIEWGDKIEHE